MKIRPVGAELFHADRQTDRHDEALLQIQMTNHMGGLVQLSVTNALIKSLVFISKKTHHMSITKFNPLTVFHKNCWFILILCFRES